MRKKDASWTNDAHRVVDLLERKTVGYMPIFGADELVYSWVSRYAWGMGSRPGAVVRRELFGPTPRHLSVLLTGDLLRLADVLPTGSPDAADLVENHTLFRYQAPFMSEEASLRLRGMLLDGWEPSVQGWFGSRRAIIPTKPYLSFCPACVHEDIARVGEPTWHRAHQLPGTEVCHVHGTRLRYGPWESGHTTLLQTCPRDVDVYPDQMSLLPERVALGLARAGADLLSTSWDFGSHPRLHAGMARIVSGAGYDRGGRIQRATFEADLRREIGDAAMIAFGLVSPASRSPAALHAVHEVRALSYCPPCRYLLVLAVLGATVRDLADAVQESPPTPAEGQSRSPRRYSISEECLARHKETILAAMREHPDWSRIDLFTGVRRAYSAVTRHAMGWWEANAPASHPRVRRLDHARRDARHSDLIRAAALRLAAATPLERRITKAAILREAGLPTHLNLQPHLTPRSLAAIAEAVRPSQKPDCRRRDREVQESGLFVIRRAA